MATKAKSKFPTVIQDLGWFIFRASVGAFMLTHGVGKFAKLFGDEPIKFMNFMGIGETASLALVVLAEFVCAILLILGLFSRWAAIPIIVAMAVAAFQVHAGDPFGDRETSLLYMVAAIGIFAIGSGNWSADKLIRKR